MSNQLIFIFMTLVAVVLATISTPSVEAQKPQLKDLPGEVRKLVGTAKGIWTCYGLNADCEVVKRTAYPDELKTEDLIVEKGRASVDDTAKMHFPGSKEPLCHARKGGVLLEPRRDARRLPVHYIRIPDYGLTGHGTIGNFYTSILNAFGDPVEHFGELDFELDRQGLPQLGPVDWLIS